MSNPGEFPCEFEEHSNQHYATGICYGMGISPEGRPFALLEYSQGTVFRQYLDGCYSIKLKRGRRT